MTEEVRHGFDGFDFLRPVNVFVHIKDHSGAFMPHDLGTRFEIDSGTDGIGGIGMA